MLIMFIYNMLSESFINNNAILSMAKHHKRRRMKGGNLEKDETGKIINVYYPEDVAGTKEKIEGNEQLNKYIDELNEEGFLNPEMFREREFEPIYPVMEDPKTIKNNEIENLFDTRKKLMTIDKEVKNKVIDYFVNTNEYTVEDKTELSDYLDRKITESKINLNQKTLLLILLDEIYDDYKSNISEQELNPELYITRYPEQKHSLYTSIDKDIKEIKQEIEKTSDMDYKKKLEEILTSLEEKKEKLYLYRKNINVEPADVQKMIEENDEYKIYNIYKQRNKKNDIDEETLTLYITQAKKFIELENIYDTRTEETTSNIYKNIQEITDKLNGEQIIQLLYVPESIKVLIDNLHTDYYENKTQAMSIVQRQNKKFFKYITENKNVEDINIQQAQTILINSTLEDNFIYPTSMIVDIVKDAIGINKKTLNNTDFEIFFTSQLGLEVFKNTFDFDREHNIVIQKLLSEIKIDVGGREKTLSEIGGGGSSSLPYDLVCYENIEKKGKPIKNIIAVNECKWYKSVYNSIDLLMIKNYQTIEFLNPRMFQTSNSTYPEIELSIYNSLQTSTVGFKLGGNKFPSYIKDPETEEFIHIKDFCRNPENKRRLMMLGDIQVNSEKAINEYLDHLQEKYKIYLDDESGRIKFYPVKETYEITSVEEKEENLNKLISTLVKNNKNDLLRALNSLSESIQEKNRMINNYNDVVELLQSEETKNIKSDAKTIKKITVEKINNFLKDKIEDYKDIKTIEDGKIKLNNFLKNKQQEFEDLSGEIFKKKLIQVGRARQEPEITNNYINLINLINQNKKSNKEQIQNTIKENFQQIKDKFNELDLNIDVINTPLNIASTRETWNKSLYNERKKNDIENININLMFSIGLANSFFGLNFSELWTKCKEIWGANLIHPIQLFKIDRDFYNEHTNDYGVEVPGTSTAKFNSLKIPLFFFDTMKLIDGYGKINKMTDEGFQHIQQGYEKHPLKSQTKLNLNKLKK